MNFANALIDLYEMNSEKVGVIEPKIIKVANGKEGAYKEIYYTLLPIFHTTATSQIEVRINIDGEFTGAKRVADDDKLTIIPITEKSGSRTAGKEPHPFCDNLRYLGGDYKEYCKDDGICYELYMNQLKKWYESDYSHPKVQAIYKYLSKKSLIKDLINQRILKTNEEGMLDEKETIQNIPQTKAFVRFVVRQTSPDNCWEDRSLRDCYIDYSRSLEQNKGICYLSGNIEEISYLHSKKIRNDGDGAKLISANDKQNFTYRGRFAEREEAFAVGNESSQKMHNALKWIIRKQGKAFDTLVFVSWESTKMINMPSWTDDTERICKSYDKQNDDDDWWDDTEENNNEKNLNGIIAEDFYKALAGYKQMVNNTSNMILVGVDAATAGRLALVEFKTLESSRYLENIEKWHKSCAWLHKKRNGKKVTRFIGMLGVKDIADILFGIEDNKGILTIVDKNSKKLYAEVAKRLLPCIWNGQRIPIDYVNRVAMKASNPLSYKKRENWERVLAVACSMVKKHRMERNSKEDWNVALDKDSGNRDYLYGRLLAVADRIEYRTYDKERDDSRVTNAKRYMNTFAQRPFETWKIIEENIQYYLNKLNFKERRYYEKILDEIYNKFEIESFKNNTKLDGLYLLGFHSQSQEFRNANLENKN